MVFPRLFFIHFTVRGDIFGRLDFWISLLWFIWYYIALNCYIVWWALAADNSRVVFVSWWPYGAGALFLGIGAWRIVVELISWVCSRVSLLKRWQPKLGQGIYLMTFALTNLVVACLYYSIAYSAEGTGKPDWTEKLG